jgi:hypothetical protein
VTSVLAGAVLEPVGGGGGVGLGGERLELLVERGDRLQVVVLRGVGLLALEGDGLGQLVVQLVERRLVAPGVGAGPSCHRWPSGGCQLPG